MSTTQHPWWARDTNRPLADPSIVRRHSPRNVLTTLLITAALVAGLGWVLTGTEIPETRPTPYPNAIERRQSTQALIGGCGGVFEFTDTEAQVVPSTRPDGAPNTQRYRMPIVPIFGPFWAEPVDTSNPQRFWDDLATAPRPENLLANQWRGWLVVYYSAQANKQDVAALAELADNNPDLQMLVVPWGVTGQDLPRGRTLAFATWNASQTCSRLVASALAQFRDLHPATQAPGADPATPFPAVVLD